MDLIRCVVCCDFSSLNISFYFSSNERFRHRSSVLSQMTTHTYTHTHFQARSSHFPFRLDMVFSFTPFMVKPFLFIWLAILYGEILLEYISVQRIQSVFYTVVGAAAVAVVFGKYFSFLFL